MSDTELTRYNIMIEKTADGTTPNSAIVENENGFWVKAGDVAELQAEVDELNRQLMAIRKGHTKTVEFDLSPAAKESALRDKLIELGWTPPVDTNADKD
jgi:hypothetical protein